MRPMTLLLTALLLTSASSAFAQDACSKRYGTCMDRCSGRSQSVQGACMESCQSNSNQCYQGMFGDVPPDGVPPEGSAANASASHADTDAAKDAPKQ